MDNRIALIGVLVAVGLAAGFWWKARTGRAKLVRSGELVDLSKLKATEGEKPVQSFGKVATLLQFSTEVCSACVATARLYRDLEKTTTGPKQLDRKTAC